MEEQDTLSVGSKFDRPSTPFPSREKQDEHLFAQSEFPQLSGSENVPLLTTITTSPKTSPSPSTPVAVSGDSKRLKPGILRLDVSKPRRSSGGSVEFRAQPELLGEESFSPTGSTSQHQLSVTWASTCVINEPETKFIPMQNTEDPTATDATNLSDKGRRRSVVPPEEKTHELSSNLTSPVDGKEFQLRRLSVVDANFDNFNGADEDEEDYSMSVSAIMQRRASIRGYRGKRGSRNSRRASSPMDQILDTGERRRSSIFTTSSEDGTNQESTQEQIFENIRIHKEVIQSVKFQPWPMRKKLKLVRQAKMYVARHEGALQERFAMSRSTKDLWARFKILMAARWRHWKREIASFLTVLIPWELRIKEIESHFGSGVASYFTFLRWLMWVNIVIAIPLVAFVIGPEYFATKSDETDPRKKMSEHEFKIAGNLLTFWEFEGYLKYSPMFYGYYSSFSGASSLGYKLPLAYFLTALLIYIYSFVATLRKMAENSRNSKLFSKDDECTFSWKLFTGWDYMIGHAETAHNRIASVIVGFKEALLEEAEKKKDTRNWRIIAQRILVNIIILALLAASGYTVVALVNNAEKLARYDNWISRNAVNVTITLLSFFLPMIFEALGLFENWHPRQQLRLQLARIMILNLLNLYSLMFSFIYNINSKEKPLQDLKIKNETATVELAQLTSLIATLKSFTTTTLGYDMTTSSTSTLANIDDTTYGSSTMDTLGSSTTEAILTTTFGTLYSTVSRLKCYNITVKCSKPTRVTTQNFATTTLLLMNLTTTMLPMTTEPITTPITTTETPIWTTLPLTTTTEETTKFTTNEPTTVQSITTPDYETYEYEDTTTPPTDNTTHSTTTQTQATSTTKIPLGNDSFFEYYDYFVGIPLEDEENDNNEPANKNFNDATQLKFLNAGSSVASKRTKRQTRQAATPSRNEESLQQLLHKREDDRGGGFETTQSYANSNLKQANTTTSLEATMTSTIATTAAPSTITTSAATANPITNYNLGDRQQLPGLVATTEQIVSERNTDPLWVSNTQLQKILDYFTTSTTTIEPPTTDETTISTTAESSTTTTTFPATTTTTDNANEDDTTPYFIDDEDISEVGEPNYLDANEIDDENFEYCVRTICEEISPETTELYATPTPANNESAVATLTPLERYQLRLTEVKLILGQVQRNLTNMCWETSLGQELSKVVVFDGLMGIIAPLCIDFLRGLFVRYLNPHWCWDMEKTFPQYGDFKIAENILTLIYNQGQVWMGVFFSPGLVLINLVKLIIMMYFRSWIVLTCNVPHEVVFKASKSNNFYLTLLLTMLFLCVLPVSYAVVWLRPSWHCGPYSEYNRISEYITNTTRNALPKQLHEPLDYLTSSSTVIPLLLLLILIIYYLVSLNGALREANQDLRTQLQKEREEERRKMFKIESKPTEQAATTLTSRWKKVLEASASPVTPTPAPDFESEEYKNQARKELISRIMKKALRKGSATSEDDSVLRRDDDDTDTEHHDALPHDEDSKDKTPLFGLSRLQQIRRSRKPSLVDIVKIAKMEKERDRERDSTTPTPTTPTPTPTTITARSKESHTKGGHSKINKHDKHENETKPQPPDNDNDNDPDVNSRIVNERRQSLMRKKREDDEHKSTETKHSKLEGKLDATIGSKSNFEIVNEKKVTADEKQRHGEASMFKFTRHKDKSTPASTGDTATEPEVFKFDEPAMDKSKIKSNKVTTATTTTAVPATADQLSTTSKHSDGSPTPSHSFGMHMHVNPDKLVNLSRQGKKKIGSLLALVREAVNTKRDESDSSNEPTTPVTPTIPTASSASTTGSGTSQVTAIDRPKTSQQAKTEPIFKPIQEATAAKVQQTKQQQQPQDTEKRIIHKSQPHKPQPMKQQQIKPTTKEPIQQKQQQNLQQSQQPEKQPQKHQKPHDKSKQHQTQQPKLPQKSQKQAQQPIKKQEQQQTMTKQEQQQPMKKQEQQQTMSKQEQQQPMKKQEQQQTMSKQEQQQQPPQPTKQHEQQKAPKQSTKQQGPQQQQQSQQPAKKQEQQQPQLAANKLEQQQQQQKPLQTNTKQQEQSESSPKQIPPQQPSQPTVKFIPNYPFKLPHMHTTTVVHSTQTRFELKDPENSDQTASSNVPKHTASQVQDHHPSTMATDSQAANWSDNIPTITISTTGSEECIIEAETRETEKKAIKNISGTAKPSSPTGSSRVNIIKINIEDEK